MSNEDIVERIQNEKEHDERQELLLALWKNVRRFVILKAKDRAAAIGKNDLIPDMLQESFIALYDAVDYYETDSEASFINIYASFFMRPAFTRAIYGGQNQLQKQVPAAWACSMDEPLTDAEGSESSLYDLIEDPESEEEFERIEQELFFNNVGAFLWEGISALSVRQKRLLVYMFVFGRTASDAWRSDLFGDGRSRWYYLGLYKQAREKLKRWIYQHRRRAVEVGIDAVIKGVQPSAYYGGGVRNFNSDHTSVVERTVLRNIAREERKMDSEKGKGCQ